jgi:hypothetical protein
MVCIRQATSDDLLQMQTTNLWCLPENYQVRLQGCGVGYWVGVDRCIDSSID